MKKFALSTLLFLFIFVGTAFSQWAKNAELHAYTSGLVINFTGQLDSTAGTYAQLESKAFDLSDYDDVGTLEVNYIFTSVPGAPEYTIILEKVGADGTTYAAEASADTLVAAGTAETNKMVSYTFTKTAKLYKLKVQQEGTGRDNTTFKIELLSRTKNEGILR